MANKPTQQTKDERLAFRLPPKDKNRFKAKAEKDGGMSKVLQRLVTTYLNGREHSRA